MIYPAQFPSNNTNPYEREVYMSLSGLMNKDDVSQDIFDIFCFKDFSGLVKGEQIEYEIDFIVADIRNSRLNGLLVIEVKGKEIRYDGETSEWYQDGNLMDRSPTKQVSAYAHNLIKRFDFLEQRVPVGWAVWFPKMQNPGQDELPQFLTEEKYFDEISVRYPKEKILAFFSTLYNQYDYMRGSNLQTYFQLKEPLIRSLGYALPLHKKLHVQEQRFIQLTENQLHFLRQIKINKDILVTGPAGSGKTIMATTIARELAETEDKVIILTYNRVLANNIRYGMGKPENPQVANYHSLARSIIGQHDKNWWENYKPKDDNFWNLEVPVKLLESLEDADPVYDYIIIDEAQDLKDVWFESLDKLVKPDGGFYIFMDEDQDIFDSFDSIPINRRFFNFPLEENCRNTIKIIETLKTYINKDIKYKPDAVEGDPVKVLEYRNDTEQMNKVKNEWLRLVDEEGIEPHRILIMMNTDRKSSCLANIKKFGKYPITSLRGRTGELEKRSVNYSSIRTFKGLEVDILFIIDTDKVIQNNKMLYTQASRAKHLLYILIDPANKYS